MLKTGRNSVFRAPPEGRPAVNNFGTSHVCVVHARQYVYIQRDDLFSKRNAVFSRRVVGDTSGVRRFLGNTVSRAVQTAKYFPATSASPSIRRPRAVPRKTVLISKSTPLHYGRQAESPFRSDTTRGAAALVPF